MQQRAAGGCGGALLLLCGSHAAVISARMQLADRTNATRRRAALEMPLLASKYHARRPTELAARNTLEIQPVDERACCGP